MARPTKRTPTTEEKIIDAIRQGMTYKLAAAYAGISYETLRNWLKQGEEGNENFAAFFQAVQRAEAEGAMRNLEFINKAWTGARGHGCSNIAIVRYKHRYLSSHQNRLRGVIA
jgi:transposase